MVHRRELLIWGGEIPLSGLTHQVRTTGILLVNNAPMAPATVDTSFRYMIVDILELNHYEHGGAGVGGVIVEKYPVWFEQRMGSRLLSLRLN